MPATLIISLPAAPIQRIVKILQVYFLIHKMGLIVISPLNVVVMDTGNHYHSEKKKKIEILKFHCTKELSPSLSVRPWTEGEPRT